MVEQASYVYADSLAPMNGKMSGAKMLYRVFLPDGRQAICDPDDRIDNKYKVIEYVC